MKIKLLFQLLLLLSSTIGFGQIEYPATFQENLQLAKVDFYEPLENSFKNAPIRKNTIQNYDLAIKSRKENLEIRYVVLPIGSTPSENFPPVSFTAKATTVADNDPEKVMAFHPMEATEVKNKFNADWGASAFFHPKAEFSTKRHCKMVALYAKGKANIYVFYLFDDLSIDLEERFQHIRFTE